MLTAQPEQIIRRRRRVLADRTELADLIRRAAGLVLLAVILLGWVFGLYAVPDNGMAPAVSAGDLVLYYRPAGELYSGELAVYTAEGQNWLGRVVARSGDTVEITDDGTLLINGNAVAESYSSGLTLRSNALLSYPLTVPEGSYFILCDTRSDPRDSRQFGPIGAESVKGRAVGLLRKGL